MNPLDRLINALSRLPGIGQKAATRLALFVLRDNTDLAQELIEGLKSIREKVRFCKLCQNLTQDELCQICKNSGRNQGQICVVQEPVDLNVIEKSGDYRGLYYVLHGAISPLDGIGPDKIRIDGLLKRLKNGKISEVILATNPNPEGEATALYLKKKFGKSGVKVTRIASGVPVGGTLEFTDAQTISRALGARREY